MSRIHISRPNIGHTKKALAAQWPELQWQLGTSRGGVRVISWTGGPDAADVHLSILDSVCGNLQFHRRPTDEEIAAEVAQWEREDTERRAAEPARRAAAKIAGIEKARETRDRKKALAAALATNFPTVAFGVSYSRGYTRIMWAGGPSVDAVASSTGVSRWECTRENTAEEDEVEYVDACRHQNPRYLTTAERVAAAAGRTARRLHKAKAKAARVAAYQTRVAKANRQLHFAFINMP